jgi:hypothetical protein
LLTGHSLKDVEAILDAHYLGGDIQLAKAAVFELEARTKQQTRGLRCSLKPLSSLAVEIDNEFKLRCLKVRYFPKARLVMP